MALNEIQDIPSPANDLNSITNWKNWKNIKSRFSIIYYTSNYGSFTDLLTDIGTASATVFVNSLITISSTTTIPSNISIKVLGGGGFISSTASSLVINGPFECGNSQCFFGDVVVTFGKELDVRPQWWGSVADNSTDDTAAIQKAVTCAEAGSGAVYFKPCKYPYRCSRINILTGGIKIYGDNTKIIQVYDTTANPGSGGAGSTKVSPVFFCTKTSSNIEITGFVFTTYDASFPSVPGWSSYLAPICINRSDNVNIHHNKFAGGQDRAIFLYGGNYCKVKKNYFYNTSIIMHIGIVDNSNFWDSVAADYSTIYGPTAPIITENYFIDYTYGNNCLFLSGPNDFTIRDNKFIGFNSATGTPIRLYVNDLGMFDGDGDALDAQSGVISGNTIRGVFENGIEVFGQAQGAAESLLTFKTRYKIENNTIEGTGVGVLIERAYELRLLNNDIKTTDAPINIKRELVDSKIKGNRLECTSKSEINSSVESTIVFDQNAVPIRSEITENEIVGPEDDLYSFFTPPGVVLRDCTIKGNTFKYNSTVSTNRVIQFSHVGALDFSENKFYINSTTLEGRHVCAINKTIGAWNDSQGYNPGYTVIPTTPNGFMYMVTSPVGDTGVTEPTWPTTIGSTVVDNQVTWTCQALDSKAIVNKNKIIYTNVRNRGFDIISNIVRCSENFGLEELSLSGMDVSCTKNHIENKVGSTTVNLIIENSTFAHVEGNYIHRPFELNTVVLSLDAVAHSKVVGNYISGFSNSPLAKAITSGRLEHYGNTFVNAGTGFAGFSVTGTAIAKVMNQETKGQNVTAANDLTLGVNGTYFDVDGSTTINGVYSAQWDSGQAITFQFNDAPTVKHNTAPSAGFAKFLLAGAVDFVATAGDTLTVKFDGTYLREISRAVI